MKIIKKIILLLVVGMFLLAGCSKSSNQVDKNQERETEISREQGLDKSDNKESANKLQRRASSAKVDINRAVELFYKAFNDQEINIKQIDFDKDRGEYTYEIEGWKDNKEYKLEIDAENESILEQEVESDYDIHQDDITIELDKIISPEKAIEEALKHVNTGDIEGWELTTDDGILVYEVDIEDGKDVVIAAKDGSLVKFK